MTDTMPMILQVKRVEKDLLFMNVLFVFDSLPFRSHIPSLWRSKDSDFFLTARKKPSKFRIV